MEAKKIFKVPAIPERLRLAAFKGTDEEKEDLESIEDERDAAILEAFQAVSSGAASVAWWTVRNGNGFRILHNSTRGDGLQLSRLEKISGEYEPFSHKDLSRDGCREFLREIWMDGCGSEIKIA